MNLARSIREEIAKQLERVAGIVRRGTVGGTDGNGFVQFKGFEDERGDEVEMWQHYGFASRPPAGVEILTVKVGADAENTIAVAETSRDKPALEIGESAIYCKDAVFAYVGAKTDAQLTVMGEHFRLHFGSYFLKEGDNSQSDTDLQSGMREHAASFLALPTPGLADVITFVKRLSKHIIFLDDNRQAANEWLTTKAKVR